MDMPADRSIEIGPFRALADASGLRAVHWHGVEVLRGLTAPIRDADWGTLADTTLHESLETTATSARYTRRFRLRDFKGQGELSVLFETAGRMTVDWRFTPGEDLHVRRAGLCLLHPLRHVAGQQMTVTRPDGSAYQARFPQAIAPAQPACDIAALAQQVAGADVTFSFSGEVFEMEDQRNWSDASFKTYCRPLAAPSPFAAATGATLRQRVVMQLGGVPERAARPSARPATALMPEILLAVEPGWLGPVPAGCAQLARFGGRAWSDEDLSLLDQAPWDAEIIVPAGEDPQSSLRDWAQRFAACKSGPRQVIALPEPYLQSIQPEGPWPKGPTPEDCVIAAQQAFPAARIGAGMLTNFTEFNRCPPPDGLGDYVTHGNSAIVHAADDLSVLQTLEALPAVFESARRLGGARDYRLGLVSIAMRSNPYGAALSDNPDGSLRTMTNCDPRQRTDFAAAYAIAATALAAKAGARAICLAAPAGPFSPRGALEPALAALASLTGQEAAITQDGSCITIAGPVCRLEVNTGLSSRNELPPASWRRLPLEDHR